MPLDPQVKKILQEAEALGLPAYQDLSPTEARKSLPCRGRNFSQRRVPFTLARKLTKLVSHPTQLTLQRQEIDSLAENRKPLARRFS